MHTHAGPSAFQRMKDEITRCNEAYEQHCRLIKFMQNMRQRRSEPTLSCSNRRPQNVCACVCDYSFVRFTCSTLHRRAFAGVMRRIKWVCALSSLMRPQKPTWVASGAISSALCYCALYTVKANFCIFLIVARELRGYKQCQQWRLTGNKTG